MPEISMTSEQEASLPTRIIWEPDGKEMILIPGGDSAMGLDDGRGNEGPQHTIRLSSFYLDRYPVTQAEYHRFAQETDHPVPSYQIEWADIEEYNWNPETRMPPADKLDHPVVLVSWEDGRAYGEWALKRLPTEAEWERAARGPEGMRWPWGNEFGRGNGNTKEMNLGRTTAVYRFSPCGDSSEGVADLIGNVWEWTTSLYWPYPYAENDGREGLEAKGWRVLRGGSWVNDLTIANATSRLDGDFLFFNNVGFRCAVAAEVVLSAMESCTDE